MSIINVPVLGSPNNLRRQLRNGVTTDVGSIPHSPGQKTLRHSARQTLRPSGKRNSVHYEPEVIDSELKPPKNMYRHRDPTPARPRSPVVRDFAYPNTNPVPRVHANPRQGSEAALSHVGSSNVSRSTKSRNRRITHKNQTQNEGTSTTALNRRLGLKRSSRKPIPAPMPISFDYEDKNNNDTDTNRDPTPIPLIPRSALRQKVAQLRLRQAQDSNTDQERHPNIPIVKPVPGNVRNSNYLQDPPTLGRGFFGFPDKKRYFGFKRNNNGPPTVDPPIEPPPPRRVRFKSISSRIGRDAWRRSQSGNQPPDPPYDSTAVGGPAPVPRRVSRSRIPAETRRGRIFTDGDIPNIDIRPPTPPHDDDPPRNDSRWKGRIPAMSMSGLPGLRMPNMRVPKRFGFPKWRTGADDGGLTDREVADEVMVQDRPASVIHERAPSLLQDHPHSIRQRATSLQFNHLMPNMRVRKRFGFPKWRTGAGVNADDGGGLTDRKVADEAMMRDRPPSIRQGRAPSLVQDQPPSIQRDAHSSLQDRPPSIRQRATSLQTNQPSSIRQRTTSLQSNRPSSIRQGQSPSRYTRTPSPRPSIRVQRGTPSPILLRTSTQDLTDNSIVLTTKKGRFKSMHMRMPAIRVWRTKGAVLEPVQPSQLNSLQLVPTSSRDRLTPSPASFQQSRTRTQVRATRPLLHHLLLTPTLLRPARLHWDVRDSRLMQRGIVERLVKEPFITPASIITYDSLTLHIPIPLASTSPYSPSTSRTSLSKISSKRSAKYWTIPIPTFTSVSSTAQDTAITPTVLQILTTISTALRSRATPHELAALYDERNWRYKREVEGVFRRRCAQEDAEREREKARGRVKTRGGGGRQERVGIRRVDLLGRKTRWLGLERGKDVEGWIVRLGNMTMR